MAFGVCRFHPDADRDSNCRRETYVDVLRVEDRAALGSWMDEEFVRRIVCLFAPTIFWFLLFLVHEDLETSVGAALCFDAIFVRVVVGYRKPHGRVSIFDWNSECHQVARNNFYAVGFVLHNHSVAIVRGYEPI